MVTPAIIDPAGCEGVALTSSMDSVLIFVKGTLIEKVLEVRVGPLPVVAVA